MMHLAPRSFVVAALFAATLVGQCDPQWQAGDPVPFVSGYVSSMTTWDPDGVGPLALQLVAGGQFQAGAILSMSIASYDGSQWLPMGTPPVGYVNALGQFNGLLVAAFQTSLVSTQIATFDGSTWVPIGNAGGVVTSITGYSGDLYIGGYFPSISGVAANNIARWNGTAWSALGSGIVGDVRAMVVFGGLLHVAGSISQAGGVAVGNLAAWNGSNFAGTAGFNGPIEKLGVYDSMVINGSRLIAAGSFTSVGGVAAQHIARFSPATLSWSAIGAGLPGTTCTALFVANSGFSYEVTAGVDSPGSAQKVWNTQGSVWVPLGLVSDLTDAGYVDVTPSSLVLFGGQYMLSLADGRVAVRRFDAGPQTWSPLLGRGVGGVVLSVCAAGNEAVIGGTFKTISGVTVNGIARGSSNAWQALGTGMTGGFGVTTVAAAPNGDIFAGGSFTMAGGVPATFIARWNGSAWSALGTGPNGMVYVVRALPNGDVLVGGNFTTAGGVAANNVARWNGSNWSALGSGTSAPVSEIAVMPNGDVVVAGTFLSAGGFPANHVARWNGVGWAPLGNGLDDSVHALAVMPNGTLAAGGDFTSSGGVPVGHVAIWTGSAWTAGVPFLGPNGSVNALTALPDGDLVAGGETWSWGIFTTLYTNLARRTDAVGLNWGAPVLRGLSVYGLTTLANGDLIVVGDFLQAGSFAAGNVARVAAVCQAAATTYGAGCAANLLTATQLPWTGGTFRARATGMPAFGFAIVVTGFSAISLPIASVLSPTLPNCNLLVAPDFLDVVVPSAGSVDTQVVLPDTFTLAGLEFFQQVVPFALGAGGNVSAITSTNGLHLTIGTF